MLGFWEDVCGAPASPGLWVGSERRPRRGGVNRLDLRVETPLTGEAEVPRGERAWGEGSPAEGVGRASG